MDLILWVYMICLLVGFIFLALSFMLGGMGDTDTGGVDAGVDAHVDAGVDAHADAGVHHDGGGGDHAGGDSDARGLSPVSPMILSLFATYFGGFGFLFTMGLPGQDWLIQMFLDIIATVILSVGSYYALVKMFVKSQASSVHTVEEMVGLTGEVTIAIPKDGAGVVDYVVHGTRVSGPARSAGPIPRGATVKIVKIVNNVLTVERTDVEL
jgi:membrane protein implicated in regulation of membrane protease activity